MPAIDILLNAVAGLNGQAQTAPTATTARGDFESAMSQALTPDGKNQAQKIAVPPARKIVATAPAPSETLRVEKPGDAPLLAAVKKKPAAVEPALSETAALPPASGLPPVEIFLTLPVFFTVPPPPENLSAPGPLPPETKSAGRAAGIWAGAPGQPESKNPGTALPENLPAVAVENLLSTGKITAPSPETVSPARLENNLAGKKIAEGGAPEKISAEMISIRPGAAEAVLPTVSGRLAMEPEMEHAGGPTKGGEKEAAIILPQGVAGKNPALVLTAPPAAEIVRVDSLPVNFSAAQIVASPVLPMDLRVPGVVSAMLPENAPVTAAGGDNNYGTGVASTVSVMKKSDKVQFFTESAGQKLPSGGPTRSLANALKLIPAEMPPRRSEKFIGEMTAPFSGADLGNNFGVIPDSYALVNGLAPLPPTEARLQMVERTHDLVSLHALRLVEAKSDTMSVVLKPSADTELSLQLRQRDGVVEAQAVLAQGDFRFLNQHWADLQARLELQGVKLAPLGGETNFNSDGGNFSRQSAPERDEAAEHALAFAEFAVAVGGASARSAAGIRGWESWA